MSNTYRRVMVYVKDGPHTCGNNARKSRSKDKPIDRRIQRRQNAKLIREHKYLMDIDATYDRLEEIERIRADEEAWYVMLEEEFERDNPRAYEDDHPGYLRDNDYHEWDEPDYSYAAGSLSRSGITNLSMNARINPKGE